MALTDYVIMPGEDYQAICDAVREKRNETEVIKSGEIAGKIQGIEATPKLQNKVVRITTIDDVTITPDKGYDAIGSVTLENTLWKERMKASYLSGLFYNCTSLTTVPLFDTSHVTNMDSMFRNCTSLTTVPLFDTSNVTRMSSMFDECTSLTTVPLFDTSKVTYMSAMFYNCTSLTTVPLFDTSKVINMNFMLSRCTSLTTVPLFDTSKVTNMSNMFDDCTSLTECWLRNIKTDLQVGSGTSYGHLLTLDSLIHLIYECRDTGSQKTLTVGSANLEKLANVYVRTIEITDEMRAEDDLIDEKLPFEVCESTDEGAMLIVDYAVEKNWSIK